MGRRAHTFMNNSPSSESIVIGAKASGASVGMVRDSNMNPRKGAEIRCLVVVPKGRLPVRPGQQTRVCLLIQATKGISLEGIKKQSVQQNVSV